MKRTILPVLATLFAVSLTTAAGAAAERPSLYGFAPAYPSDTLPRFTTDKGYPAPPRSLELEIVLTIDQNGAVTSVTSPDSLFPYLIKYVHDYLAGLTFVPAERSGEKVASKLPVWAGFATVRSFPDFTFPIDNRKRVSSRERYIHAVELNGVTAPKLVSFPSYFEEVRWSDTLQPYPFVLLKLTLGPDGHPTAIDTVLSTRSGLTMTTASAALWATYKPAEVNGAPIVADCYLLVSYFPQVVYPTHPWEASRADSMPMLERFRVNLFADTVGLMARPLPRKMPGNVVTMGEARALYGTIGAVFAVDTTGVARVIARDRIPQNQWRVLRLMARRMSFYPARAYDGSPRNYSGLVKVVFDGSEKVRIEYVW